MAARNKRIAAIAAAALAALLFSGCADEPVYSDRTYAESLAGGGIRAVCLSPVIGYYAETTDGTPFFFSADEGVTVVGNLVAHRSEVSFDGYTPGDKIVVWYSIIEETYPSHIYIYDIELVKAGEPEDMPQAILDEIAARSEYFS